MSFHYILLHDNFLENKNLFQILYSALMVETAFQLV